MKPVLVDPTPQLMAQASLAMLDDNFPAFSAPALAELERQLGASEARRWLKLLAARFNRPVALHLEYADRPGAIQLQCPPDWTEERATAWLGTWLPELHALLRGEA